MYRIFKRVSAVVATLALVAGFTRAAFTQAKYAPGPPFPEPAEELYGITAGGKMYVMGGLEGGKAMGMVYELDPATDKWTKKKDMALPTHHEALATLNGKIYMFGGFVPPAKGGGWMPIDNAWEYDPVADTWTALPPMPTKRGSAIAFEVGGKFYVIGGAGLHPGATGGSALGATGRSVDANEMYDPATKTWTSRTTLPTARNHMFGGVVGNKIYVIGGRLSTGGIMTATNSDLVEIYDPTANTWEGTGARMPTPRSGGGSGVFGGRIYAAGGEVNTAQLAGAFRAVEVYDPAGNKWTSFVSMPNPRHGVAAAVLGTKLHLVSGNVTSGGGGAADPKINVHTEEHNVIDLPDCRGVATSCP